MMGLLVANQLTGAQPELGWVSAAIVNGAYGLVAGVTTLACALTHRRLRRSPNQAARALRRLDKLLTVLRFATLGVFYAGLFGLGYLRWLSEQTNLWLLVNELVVLAGPLAVVMVAWWMYYPIDRRLREAALLRQIDEGQPVWPLVTRRQYLLNQVRHQLLLMLLPLLMLLAWGQIVDRMVVGQIIGPAWSPLLLAGGGIGAFLLAPLVIRHVWDTEPMPAGELRHRLLEMCRRHRVKVRQLLLWRTYGGVINGAVMGLVGPLRYILLTDGLLNLMPGDQVEAVMAHELGHVRKRHMIWLVVCALGTLVAVMTGVELATEGALWGAAAMGLTWAQVNEPSGSTLGEDLYAGALALGAIAAWAPLFGYLSRRFERQADAFAVQHLAAGGEDGLIPEQAAQTMARALANVAHLNNIPAERPSWRHGSIRWRMDYLQSIIGQPVGQLPIDRQVRWMCWACAGAGAAAVGVSLALGM